MWERWNSFSIKDGYNPQSMNSLNHYAYGAIGQWMYESIAGLAALEPGYKTIRMAPKPNTQFLNEAAASVKTPYGTASSSWKIENDTFYLEAVIPPNTTAEIVMPYGDAANLLVNDQVFKDTEDLKLDTSEAGSLHLIAKPGTYKFQAKL